VIKLSCKKSHLYAADISMAKKSFSALNNEEKTIKKSEHEVTAHKWRIFQTYISLDFILTYG
jgi:hypothetical protein